MNRHLVHRIRFPPPPRSRDVSSDERAALDAQLRACPPSRMLDYGMDQAEADHYVACVGAGTPWMEPGVELAERRRALAHDAASCGLNGSARAHRRAAAVITGVAQLNEPGRSARKQQLYRQLVADYTAGAVGDPSNPVDFAIERIDVADHPEIVGWLRRPARVPSALVMTWGGLSGWGVAYHRCTDALVRHGVAVCLAELPGQGEPRVIGGHHMDARLAVSVKALIDALRARVGQAVPIGVWGNSVGGMFALHVAAAGLVDACCTNSAAGDPHVQMRRFPRLRRQFADLLGTSDDDVGDHIDGLRFVPGRDEVRCPLLTLHGERDPLESDSDARKLHARSGSRDPTLVTVAGAGHCLYAFAHQRDALVADWFTVRLSPETQP